MQYTVSQQQAISAEDGNLQIIACAGSGKTQVISARVVELLASGTLPSQIVAFTFTDKAAGELKDRIYTLCNNKLGTDRGLAETFIGTVHSYCLALLQSPPLYQFLKCKVLTDVQQRLFIDRFPQRSGLTMVPLLKGGTLQRWKDSHLYQQLLSLLRKGNVDRHQIPVAVLTAERSYQDLCREHGYLDYTTIISEEVQSIQQYPGLRAKIQAQVKHVIVDEYQDINPLQEQLITELHHLGAQLCVVGDDDQTIYAWRGSEANNIISFAQRYPQVQSLTLNENFRSSPGIVQAARHVVEKNPRRLPKRMESALRQPYEPGDILALEFSDPGKEACWIAKKIQELYGSAYRDAPEAVSRGLTYSDFAILLRSVRHDAVLIRAGLEDLGIPSLVGGMNGLFETREIRAVCAAFSFLADVDPPFLGNELFTVKKLSNILAQAGLGSAPGQIEQSIGYLQAIRKRIRDEERRHPDLLLQGTRTSFFNESI